MKITANLSKGELHINGAVYPVSNKIRTVKDGTRKSSEVVRSTPGKWPYDPQPFPKGMWEITGIEWQETNGKKAFDYNTYGPVKIKTNAWQMVNVWGLDAEGDYLRETNQLVRDECYWLHYSNSSTTLGCIRFQVVQDIVQVARVIEELLAVGEKIELEVV